MRHNILDRLRSPIGDPWVKMADAAVEIERLRAVLQAEKDAVDAARHKAQATFSVAECMAGAMLCLLTSPRFQNMTVADAIHELRENGCLPAGLEEGA